MHDSEPYLGAIVHYRRVRGSERKCFAAVVTDVNERLHHAVSLTVFAPLGHTVPEQTAVTMVLHNVDEEYSWHWRTECDR